MSDTQDIIQDDESNSVEEDTQDNMNTSTMEDSIGYIQKIQVDNVPYNINDNTARNGISDINEKIGTEKIIGEEGKEITITEKLKELSDEVSKLNPKNPLITGMTITRGTTSTELDIKDNELTMNLDNLNIADSEVLKKHEGCTSDSETLGHVYVTEEDLWESKLNEEPSFAFTTLGLGTLRGFSSKVRSEIENLKGGSGYVRTINNISPDDGNVTLNSDNINFDDTTSLTTKINKLVEINKEIEEDEVTKTLSNIKVNNNSNIVYTIPPNINIEGNPNIPASENPETLKDINIGDKYYTIPKTEILPNQSETPTVGNLSYLMIDDKNYKIEGGGSGEGTHVEANPTEEPSDTLEKIKIEDTVYGLKAGSNVTPNPSEDSTASLKKIKIEDATYSIDGGVTSVQVGDGEKQTGDVVITLPIIQVTELPEAKEELEGKILQYTGETNQYINGYFYKCTFEEGKINFYKCTTATPFSKTDNGIFWIKENYSSDSTVYNEDLNIMSDYQVIPDSSSLGISIRWSVSGASMTQKVTSKVIDDTKEKTETILIWKNIKVQPNNGGEGGTSDYKELNNKPEIGGVTLIGNKTLSDLGINNFDGDYEKLTNIPDKFTPEEHTHTMEDITDLEVGDKVSVSATGTSTNKIDYITINDTEYKLAGSGEGGSSTLSGLSDVNLNAPSANQVLTYDAENREWINANTSSGTKVEPVEESSVSATEIHGIKIDDNEYKITGEVESINANKVIYDNTSSERDYNSVQAALDGIFGGTFDSINYKFEASSSGSWKSKHLLIYKNNILISDEAVSEYDTEQKIDNTFYIKYDDSTGFIKIRTDNEEICNKSINSFLPESYTIPGETKEPLFSKVVPKTLESTDKITEIKIDDKNYELAAQGINYDNTTSELEATNVQAAIDILANLTVKSEIKNNTIYINENPLMLIGDTSIYIDAENGNDETGDGTEEKPYKTFEKLKLVTPTILNSYIIDIYISGNFKSEILEINQFFGGWVRIHFINNPIIWQLQIIGATVTLDGNVTIDSTIKTKGDYTAAVYIRKNAIVTYQQGTMTIVGSETPKIRCLQIYENAILILASWLEGFIKCQNAFTGIRGESNGTIAETYGSYGSLITYNNCSTDTDLITGSSIQRSQW